MYILSLGATNVGTKTVDIQGEEERERKWVEKKTAGHANGFFKNPSSLGATNLVTKTVDIEGKEERE